MNKFRELLLGNLPIKILSFSIATVFWFVTMNLNNPVVEKDIVLSLDLKNEHLVTDKNFVIVNRDILEKTNIQVTLRGKRNDIDSLRRYPDAVEAYIDLSTIDLSNESNIGQTISIVVNVVNHYEDTFTVTNAYPLTVLLNIDVVETKTVPLYANVTGTPKTSYVLSGNPILAKSSVSITGPKTLLDTVSKAVLPLDVEGASIDVEKDVLPVILDEKDNNVSNAIYSGIEPVNITQKIAKATTVEIISPSLVGTLPVGRTLVDYTTNIQSIDVLADESNPNLSFNSIVLNPIDISFAMETQDFEEDITQKLAEAGLVAKEPSRTIVKTTLIIEPHSELLLNIPVENVIFSNVTYPYLVMNTDDLTITVSGPADVLEFITADDVSIYCELPVVPDRTEYLGVLEVWLPEDVSLVEPPSMLNIVIDSDESDESDESDSNKEDDSQDTETQLP